MKKGFMKRMVLMLTMAIMLVGSSITVLADDASDISEFVSNNAPVKVNGEEKRAGTSAWSSVSTYFSTTKDSSKTTKVTATYGGNNTYYYYSSSDAATIVNIINNTANTSATMDEIRDRKSVV